MYENDMPPAQGNVTFIRGMCLSGQSFCSLPFCYPHMTRNEIPPGQGKLCVYKGHRIFVEVWAFLFVLAFEDYPFVVYHFR